MHLNAPQCTLISNQGKQHFLEWDWGACQALISLYVVLPQLNYNAKKISQNCENICGDKRHQKPGGHILSQKNRTAISHAMERSWVWSQIQLNFVTAP
jgi:hypothetical protein